MRSAQGPNTISLALAVQDVEARAAQHAFPLDQSEAASVAWIGELLERLKIGCKLAQVIGRFRLPNRLVGDDGVDDADLPAGHQHAKGLGGEAFHAIEMVGGKAADYEIEARIGEGKILGLG